MPFPDPGEPNRMTAGARRGVSDWQRSPYCVELRRPRIRSGAGEAFVVPHDQLSLDLVYRIHRNTDHDQQRSTAEEEIDAETIEQPPRKMGIDEISCQWQMLQPNP